MAGKTPEIFGRHAYGFSKNFVGQLQQIGLAGLDDRELAVGFRSLKSQLGKGLQPKTADLGLGVYKTGIPIVGESLWQHASKRPIFVLELGGENLKLSVAQKNEDGSLSVEEPIYTNTFLRGRRDLKFSDFIKRMATPIVDLVSTLDETRFDVGISLGLPHKTEIRATSVDAVLDTADGHLPKETYIRDWAYIPYEKRGIAGALRGEVNRQSKGKAGINTVVVLNDAVGVATDINAAARARAEGHLVLPAGFVGGTGTNAAVEVKTNGNLGLVNTEIGHAIWPDSLVSQLVRDRLRQKGLLDSEKVKISEVEYETGSYLPLRIAAALVRGAEGMNHAVETAMIIEKAASQHPSLVSDLASGEVKVTQHDEINKVVEGMAQAALDREAQIYGLLAAASADRVQNSRTADQPQALLTEGSAILKSANKKGKAVRVIAEEVAAKFAQPIVIYDASSRSGVAAVTMTHRYRYNHR